MVSHPDSTPGLAKASRWFSRILWIGLVVALGFAIRWGYGLEDQLSGEQENSAALRRSRDLAQTELEDVVSSLSKRTKEEERLEALHEPSIVSSQPFAASQRQSPEPSKPDVKLIKRLTLAEAELELKNREIEILKGEIARLTAEKPASHHAPQASEATNTAMQTGLRRLKDASDRMAARLDFLKALEALPAGEGLLWLREHRKALEPRDLLWLIGCCSPALNGCETLVEKELEHWGENAGLSTALVDALVPYRTESALSSFRYLIENTRVPKGVRAKCLTALLESNEAIDVGDASLLFFALNQDDTMRVALLRLMGSSNAPGSAETLAHVFSLSRYSDRERVSVHELKELQDALILQRQAAIVALQSEHDFAHFAMSNPTSVKELQAEIQTMISTIEASAAKKDSK